MITLKQIWEEIKSNDSPNTNEDNYDWKPIKKIDYQLPKVNIPDMKRNYSIRDKLGKVLAFIDLVKYLRYSEGCTVMPISCTNKRLKSICGNSKEVSRLIQFMKEIGLLKDECSDYQFGANNSKYNKSKTYQYFFENEVQIREYCLLNSIDKWCCCNYKVVVLDTVVDNIFFPIESVKFSSKLHLLKPSNWSCERFEDYLLACLYHNYEKLAHYQQLADKINNTYYKNNPEFQIRYEPTYEWNKGHTAIRKIGIRATNQLSNMPKEEREQYNIEHKFNLEKDVTSSVPRLSLSMSLHYWISESIDIYRLIWERYCSTISECSDVVSKLVLDTVVDNIFEEQREAIKHLTLPCYFDYDDDRLGNHIRRRMKNKHNKDEIYLSMSCLQQAVRDITMTDFDNEIFYHESNIYMEVLARLLEDGYWVWQVYDNWYAKKDNVKRKDYEEYVTKLVEEKANNYIGDYYGI